MTRNEMGLYIRGLLDTDEQDLPDSVLTPFLREGFRQAMAFHRRWPHLEVDGTFSMVAGTASYDMATLLGGDVVVGDIVEMHSSQTPLEWVDPVQARRFWMGVEDVTGNPTRWSVWAGKVRLWPTPVSSAPVHVLAIRRPNTAWVDGAAGQPDAPEEFHLAVCDFALGQVYAQQEDTDLAQWYVGKFNAALKGLKDDLASSPQAQPLVLNGGMRSQASKRVGGRLLYPFEV